MSHDLEKKILLGAASLAGKAVVAGASSVHARHGKKKSVLGPIIAFIFTYIVVVNTLIFSLGIKYVTGVVICVILSFVAAFFAARWSYKSGSKDGKTVSDRLNRTVISGTDEAEAHEVVSQLEAAAEKAVAKYGHRQGRAGVALRRTRDGKGDIVIPWPQFFAGTLVVGSSGSGKSSGILYPLLEELVSLNRACILCIDVKGDYTSMLFKREKWDDVDPSTPDIEINKPVYLLNPSDRDSIQFQLIVHDAKQAEKFAEICIRKDKSDQAYFVDAARDVFSGILLGLQSLGELTWGRLFDVIAHDDIELIRSILSVTNKGKLYLSHVDPDAPGQTGGILSTMKKEVKFIADIADVWTNPTFNVKEFIQEANGLVILRNNPEDILSQKMVQLFAEMAFSAISPLRDYNDNTYILFADELSNAVKLNLTYSTSFLRSKSLAHILSFQDVDRMRDIYGDKQFNTMFENCATKVVLKSGTETAEWFSKSFGDRMLLQESESNNQSVTSMSMGNSVQDQIVTERTINYGRIIGLPAADGNATGLFVSTGVNVAELSWDQNITKLKPIYRDFIEADWVRV